MIVRLEDLSASYILIPAYEAFLDMILPCPFQRA